jgi:phosphohistidine phosphatase
MDIILVRHAIALDRDEAKSLGMLDRDRPLTPKGQGRMRRVARGLAEYVPEVSELITSPLRRAVETAAILQKQFKGVKVSEHQALLPEAEPAELARLLGETQLAGTALVVGHEPHLSSWASWCLTGDVRGLFELRKGGACLLRFEEAPGPAKGRLLWLLTPAALRRL